MAPAVFEDGQFDYVQEHLRILSGFIPGGDTEVGSLLNEPAVESGLRGG